MTLVVMSPAAVAFGAICGASVLICPNGRLTKLQPMSSLFLLLDVYGLRPPPWRQQQYKKTCAKCLVKYDQVPWAGTLVQWLCENAIEKVVLSLNPSNGYKMVTFSYLLVEKRYCLKMRGSKHKRVRDCQILTSLSALNVIGMWQCFNKLA